MRSLRGPHGPAILAAFAEEFPQAVFAEIGANDGIRLDPLHEHIVARDWRGVLVEPAPAPYARLRSNYAEVGDRVSLVQAAITDADGPVPFYVPAGLDESSPFWHDMVGSLSPQRLRPGSPFVFGEEIEVEAIEVPGMTFEALCREHGIEALDLLLIDAEGHDWEILRSIDFSRHRPRLVIYETVALEEADRGESIAHMRALGYETMPEHYDTWCHDPRADDRLARCWRGAVRRHRLGELWRRVRGRLPGRERGQPDG